MATIISGKTTPTTTTTTPAPPAPPPDLRPLYGTLGTLFGLLFLFWCCWRPGYLPWRLARLRNVACFNACGRCCPYGCCAACFDCCSRCSPCCMNCSASPCARCSPCCKACSESSPCARCCPGGSGEWLFIKNWFHYIIMAYNTKKTDFFQSLMVGYFAQIIVLKSPQ